MFAHVLYYIRSLRKLCLSRGQIAFQGGVRSSKMAGDRLAEASRPVELSLPDEHTPQATAWYMLVPNPEVVWKLALILFPSV